MDNAGKVLIVSMFLNIFAMIENVWILELNNSHFLAFNMLLLIACACLFDIHTTTMAA